MKKAILLLAVLGYLKAATLSGYIWFDKNLNGIKDIGEKGIKGVKVYLLKNNSLTSKYAISDNEGRYIFTDLEGNNNYKIKVDIPPKYYYYTIPNVDNNTHDYEDSDVYPSTKMSDNIYLKENETYEYLYAGFACFACKKIDLEKYTNNVDADIGKGPVIPAGSEVSWKYVIKNLGNVKLTDIELSDDKEGLIDCPKDYLEAGKSMTCIKKGIAKSGAYENLAKVTARYNSDSVMDEDYSHYFGKEAKKGCIGDFYWYDENLNSVYDENEPGVIGVEVELYGKDKNLLNKTLTDENGEYKFCNLEAGQYYVKFQRPKTYLFVKENIGDETKDSDVNRYGWSGLIDLKEGENNFSVDAGIYCKCYDREIYPRKYTSYKLNNLSIHSGIVLLFIMFLINLTFRAKEKR